MNVSKIFAGVLLALAAAPASASDPGFAKFGNLTFECEQSAATPDHGLGLPYVMHVAVDVEKYAPTISFLDNGNVVKTEQTQRYIAIPQMKPDKFGQVAWIKRLINLSWPGGQLQYNDETGHYQLFVDVPNQSRSIIWICVADAPITYPCTPRAGNLSVCE